MRTDRAVIAAWLFLCYGFWFFFCMCPFMLDVIICVYAIYNWFGTWSETWFETWSGTGWGGLELEIR